MNDHNLEYYNFNLQHDVDVLLLKVKDASKRLRNELKSTQGGSLYMKKSKAYTIFTEYSNGREHSIGRDKNRVHALARRKYISTLSKNLESNYQSLKQLSMDIRGNDKTYAADSVVHEYAQNGLDVSRILHSPKQQTWLAQPYERNPAYPEELKFPTTNGVLMRTKSEVIIANRLEHFLIPYLPEMPFWFPYNMYPIYPDFTILRPDGSIIIWEHMGLMDDEKYFLKSCRKIRDYRQNGYSQHTNLIITWEDDIIEANMIDDIIKSRILH